MDHVTSDIAAAAPRVSWDRVLETLLIFLLFFVLGSGVPPAANEAHYLGKARHFWNPSWCAEDPFLQSANAHLVFYWAFGWTTQWLSLNAAAWLGRAIGCLWLSWAWLGLSRSIVPQRGYGLLSAALWATLVDRFHMSGEWIIDGIEAKVFAYPLVLLGLTDLVRGRWQRLWLWFGAAAALHVVVGGWAMIMGLFCWIVQPRDARLGWLPMLPAVIVGGCLALPGLIPAVSLAGETELQQQANEIYVFERLSHHLRLRSFGTAFVLRHLLLIAVFGAMAWPVRHELPLRRLLSFIVAAIFLALCGALIDLLAGTTTWGASLLRFYWFRCSDVFVPLGVALLFSHWHGHRAHSQPRLAGWVLVAVLCGLGLSIGETMWKLQSTRLPAADRQGAISSVSQWHDWRNLGHWCRTNIPPDALVLAPLDHQTFRWYADRSELVNRKDVPQDAEGIIQWRLRRDQSAEFYDALEDGDGAAAKQALDDLSRAYSIDYVVTRSPLPFVNRKLTPIHQNQHYMVFHLATESEMEPAAVNNVERE